jgi:L-histidine N-alpha-methyltransferase
LLKCRQELSGLGAVSIVGLEKSYLEGLAEVAARRRPGQSLLVLFLGSTIGNFDRAAGEQFLRDIRGCLFEGDAILLATDLEKRASDMLSAYDDAAGVTRAFNMNLLARINRELDGNFMLQNFDHAVRYDDRERRIEMHLRSKRRQNVRIRAADFGCDLRENETIWTEACHKFRAEEIPAMARRTGFTCEAQWVDEEWPFAENLWLAGPT